MKLTLTIALFSFITGTYFTVLVEKNRELSKACHVTYSKGNEVNVLVGEWDK